VTGRRWTIEEDHEFGKDQFGFDQSQVRLYTPIMRHAWREGFVVLRPTGSAALAVCWPANDWPVVDGGIRVGRRVAVLAVHG
jgi:hypothetical protein